MTTTEIIKLQVFSPKCVLMRQALSESEQIALALYLKEHDRSQFYMSFANNPKSQAMAQIRKQGEKEAEPRAEIEMAGSSSKSQTNFRFIFENNNPYINLDTNDDSIFNAIIRRLNEVLRSHPSSSKNKLDIPPIPETARLEVGAQGYRFPNGFLGRHTDRDESLVYLLSLGCTARFLIKTPEMDEDIEIDFESGDVLYFDASPQAHVEHAVLGVASPETSPPHLVAAYDYLTNHRLGIQYRLYPSLS